MGVLPVLYTKGNDYVPGMNTRPYVFVVVVHFILIRVVVVLMLLILIPILIMGGIIIIILYSPLRHQLQ